MSILYYTVGTHTHDKLEREEINLQYWAHYAQCGTVASVYSAFSHYLYQFEILWD